MRTNGHGIGEPGILRIHKKTTLAQPLFGSPVPSNGGGLGGNGSRNGGRCAQEVGPTQSARQVSIGLRFRQPTAEIGADDDKDHDDMVRLIGGCEDALESLMQRHAQKLISQLMRLLRNQTEARECVQEAFVRVYFHRHAFHLEARFSTWLYTIAFNLARDRLRWRARRPELVSLEVPGPQEEGDLEEILLDSDRPPDQAMENQEWSQALAEAVAGLPDPLRQPLVLFVEEDKSQPEIAAELQCSAKAVEMRLYHARKRLRFLLEHRLKEHEGFGWPKRISS